MWSQVLKYQETLLSYIERHRGILRKFQNQEAQLRTTVSEELSKLRRWSVTEVVPVYREQSQVRLVRLRLQKEMEERCIEVLELKLAAVFDLLSGIKPSAINAVDDAFFAKPVDLCLQDEDVLSLRRKIVQSEHRLKQITITAASFMQQFLRPFDQSHASMIMKQVVHQTHVVQDWGDTCVHEPHDGLQQKFDNLILDERNREGRRVRRWLDLVHAPGNADITPSSVMLFVEDMAVQVANRYGPQHLPVFRLYVARAVFPMLCDVYITRYDRDLAARNLHFVQQQRWLRERSPADIGVPDRYAGGEHTAGAVTAAYRAAVGLLEDLSFAIVPNDMMYCIYCVAQSIYAACTELDATRNDPSEGVGADVLFPLFVYVTIHATLPTGPSSLQFVSDFASDVDKRTEMGYYLTCLEGAMAYIETVTPDEIAAFARAEAGK